ncbi:MAG TPA: amino acid adenylation domain-containing protein, partial [Thioploca sp.]|nr:amino acid adenylation domain-containing protein [Thioploca sp.]
MKPIKKFLSKLNNLNIKLWIEDNQLRYKAPKGALTPTLRAELVERKAEILTFLSDAQLEDSEATQPPIEPISRADNLPLSFAQQRLWFLDQLEGSGSATYNMASALRLVGPLHFTALQKSLLEIVQRHETLRTTFQMHNETPVQLIHPSAADSFSCSVVDLQLISSDKKTSEVQQLTSEDAQRPFDLTKGPLLRTTLWQLGPQEHIIGVTMHHIISDGWSLGLFIREFTRLYEAFSQGRPSPLAPLPIQYADFAYWQRQWLSGEVLQKQLNYWQQQLTDVPALLELPTDHPRPPIQRFQGRIQAFEINHELSNALNQLSQQADATLFMTLLTAFVTLLRRYSGSDDIVVGSPIAGRNNRKTESLIGFFVNTLVLRLNRSGNPSFLDLLAHVRQVCLEAYAHQEVPFEQLVDVLQPERNLSHTPLFQVVFVLQNTPTENLALANLSISPFATEHVTAKFDLTLSMTETAHGISGRFEYNTDLFNADTITRLVGHFKTLLASLVTNPAQSVAELSLLTEKEKHQLLVEWNNTAVAYPQDQCLHQLFEAQVERTPEAIAVVFEDQQLTYQALNTKANQLAHHLQTLGVKPEVLVGICVERSVEMVIGLLGILKAGGAYLPLDPAYPMARLAFMLEDAKVKVLLSQSSLVDKLPSHQAQVVYLDTEDNRFSQLSSDNPRSEVSSLNLAYVIYTSGSTGKPKGVAIEHYSTVTLLFWSKTNFTPKQLAGVLASTSLSFDLSVFELFVPLSWGGKVILVENALSLPALSDEVGVTLINTVPSAISELVKINGLPTSVEVVNLAGEPLSHQLVQQIYQIDTIRQVFNLYGPSEDTTYSTFILVRSNDSPTIGCPIANTKIFILDKYLQPTPIGVQGELHIGGAGLARCYLNRPELTAEKFIPNFLSDDKNARIYKTGDLARYLQNGNIEYLGRIDNQVKIRGFRIELNEIEAVLGQHPKVQENAVVVHETSKTNKRLVAYIVPHLGQIIENTELRGFLKERLPDYMIPSVFVTKETLPLTPNGKIDRRTLVGWVERSETHQFQLSENTFVAPRTPEEELLAGIWADLLGIERVGVHDNFFEIGGHSLLATQVMSRLRDTFAVELPLRLLFESPTIAELSNQIVTFRRKQSVGTMIVSLPTIVPTPEQRYQPFPLTDIQQAYWLGRNGTFELGNVATHGYVELDCDGLDLKRLNRAWQILIERHEMLRMVVLPTGQQQILEQVPPYQITVMDLCGQTPDIVTTELEAIRQQMSHQVLPADQWPLFDIRATRLDKQRIRLHLSSDALIADAWGLQIIAKEWLQLYQNPDRQLTPLTLSFRDYVLAEQAWQKTEGYQRFLAYWLNRLDTLPPAPQLPLAQNPATITQPQFQRRSAQLDSDHWQPLKQRASQAGLSPSGVLLAAFADILTLWSKQPRLTLNLTLFNRLPIHPQVNDIVGDFTSLLLVAVDNSKPDTFTARARRIQQQLWEDLEHRYVSGVRVQRELARQQGDFQKATMPIVFTSTLTLNFEQEVSLKPFGEVVYSITQTPQVWLDHQVSEKEGQLVFNWDAVEALFPAGLLDDMFEAYCRFLRELAKSDSAWQATTTQFLIPPPQLSQRASVNATEAPISDEMLHTLFIAQLPTRGHEYAVISPQRNLTYLELSQLANQVGFKLRQLGASPNTLVAIVMEKGWEQVVAVLGVLMSGAAYLPIDPEWPKERQWYLFEQGEVKLVLTQSQLNQQLAWPNSIQRLCLDNDDFSEIENSSLEIIQKPKDLAYVIFTSGSTGQPKGVMIDHRGAVNTITDINQRFGVGYQDRVLALSALSFDLSVYDIFGLLAAGGTIIIPDAHATREPAHWLALMSQHQVTVWNTVPALMHMLVDYVGERSQRVAQSLRLTLMSGDWIPLNLPQRIKSLRPNAQVISLGGATEASIWSISYPIETVEPTWKSIPYGKPLTNQTFHVFNELLVPCPVWVPGQLYIGGIGLALGYWRDEEKTQNSFVIHPHTQERLYKTGDLGRYLPDGNIEFLGRLDNQVKIRGYRIELGEIETALQQHRAIKDAVVNVVGDSRQNQQLVAYLVPHQSQEEDYAPDETKDVILDPVERLEFKLKQPGLRQPLSEQTSIPLFQPEFDETLTQTYLERQSYRQFVVEPISFQQLSLLLSSLLQMKVAGAPLPKYRYPSAGNLYPVQTYLSVKPNRVAGLEGGIYYYHPAEHRLVLLHAGDGIGENAYGEYGGFNQRIFEPSAFSLFLIGQLNAITPLYGDWARDFCLLEAGYMSQLLMEMAPKHQIGLCPIGNLDFETNRALFCLEDSQILLHSFLGGKIVPAQTQQWLHAAHQSVSITESLQHYLEQKLPAYMIPSTYIRLDALPLTANGKVDRNALPVPEHHTLSKELNLSTATFVAPRTSEEKLLASIWSEILGLKKVGIHDDFFEKGGDSLLAIQLLSRIRETWSVELPLRYLFESPTVAGIVQVIDDLLIRQEERVATKPLIDLNAEAV